MKVTAVAPIVLATVVRKRARVGALSGTSRLTCRAIVLATAATLCTAATLGAQTDAAAPPTEQSAAPSEVAVPARAWPPPYNDRRFEENWKPLDWSQPHKGSRDVFDTMKVVPLSDSGSAWIGFGGALRGRLAYQSTVTYGGPFEFEPTMWTFRFRGHTDLHLGKFRAFGEYIYSNSQIEALVDSLGASDSRLGIPDSPNLNGDILNLFGEYASGIGSDWHAGVWAGRRELLMGHERILSPGNWLLNRHTFDGGGGWLNNGNHRLEGFVTRPRVPIPDRFTRRDDKMTLWGLFYTTTAVARSRSGVGNGVREHRVTFEPYLLDSRRKDVTFVQGTADDNRYTMGLLAYGDVGATGFDFEAEAMYQYGRYETPYYRGIINAYAWMAKMGYRLTTVWLSPKPSVSFDYASGDSNPEDSSLGTFDPLYPLAWQFYGFHAAFDRKNFVTAGLHLEAAYKSFYFRTSYLPAMWRAQLNDGIYNSFNEIARRPEPQSRGGNTPDLLTASRDIGKQFDFGVFWQATHNLQFYGTYLHFFAGQFWADTQTAPTKDMNGVMLLTQFQF